MIDSVHRNPAHASVPAASVPDWPAAATAGFAAGAILMVLDLVWSLAVTGEGPWATSHRIAATVMGGPALEATEFSLPVVAVALAMHYALGIASGLALAAAMAHWRLDRNAALAFSAGAAFGLGVYVVNFYGLVAFYPWFIPMRGWPTIAAHVVFGVSIALLYPWLSRRRAQP